MSVPGLYDPTEVMNASVMSRCQKEGWIKLAFFLLCFFYYLYRWVIVNDINECTYMYITFKFKVLVLLYTNIRRESVCCGGTETMELDPTCTKIQ